MESSKKQVLMLYNYIIPSKNQTLCKYCMLASIELNQIYIAVTNSTQ